MYPILIQDNFFDYPDRVVEYANSLPFFPGNGNWPGKRTAPLNTINEVLHQEICTSILKIFYPEDNYMYVAELCFQKIEPFSEDQYDIKNRGWIHRDENYQFGGIIYLNKDPEPDTGTSVYESKTLTGNRSNIDEDCKVRFYQGQPVSDEEYERHFYSTPDKWKETVRVENVYNRLFMFNSKTFHGVNTFGTRERLTLSFFFKEVCSSKFTPPGIR
tara:strand:+ start:345 stop:992 length:648 start_codon:yes stop_codon:yes gene_type:complete